MNGIHQVLVSIAKEEFKFLTVFWVHLNLNGLFDGTVDDILKTFVILNGSDTEKAIG
jgi:hypothetical protein